MAHLVITHVFTDTWKSSLPTYLCTRNEGNVLFNDSLSTFYLQFYVVEHMVKDHSYSERGTQLLPLHGLLFPISSKGSFAYTIPQT